MGTRATTFAAGVLMIVCAVAAAPRAGAASDDVYRRWAAGTTTAICATTATGVRVSFGSQVIEFNNLPAGAQYTFVSITSGSTYPSGPFPVEQLSGTRTLTGAGQAFVAYPFSLLLRFDTLVGGRVVYRSTLDLSCAADGSRVVDVINEVIPPAPYRRWVSPKTVTCSTTASGVEVSVFPLDTEYHNLPVGAKFSHVYVENGVRSADGPFPVEQLNGTRSAYATFSEEFPSYPFTYLLGVETLVGGQIVYRSMLDMSCTTNGTRTVSAVNEVTPPTTPTPSTGPAADLVTVQPARLFDSRTGVAALPAGSVTQVQVTGRAGVPAGASAAALNITAVGAGAAGFMTVFPCATAVPEASNLNYRAGQTIPNAAVVKLDPAGRVCVFTSAASGLLVDVNGYTPAASDVVALNPFRLYDSRTGAGARPAGSITEVQVAGAGGVAVDAGAALLNVTAVGAHGDGFMTVFPCGTAVPVASNLNYRAGHTIANAVLARIGAGGKVCVYSDTAADLIVDVNAAVPATSDISAVDPHRLYDTRNGAGPAGAGTTTTVQVTGAGGVPAGATTAVLNVTALEASDAGFVTVIPCGTALPVASNLNFAAGDTIPNAVIAKLSPAGSVCLFTSSATGLIVDVNGYVM